MKSFTKVMATLGIASCAGVSLLPLGSVVAESTATKDINVKLTPVHAISVDAATKEFSLAPGGDPVTNQTTVLTCASNSSTGYKVTVASVNDDEDTSHTTTASKIASLTSGDNKIVSSTSVSKGNSAYAIKTTEDGSWQLVPAKNGDALTVATTSTTSASGGDEKTVYWGFSAASNQPSGEYTDSVTFTIATNGDGGISGS